MSVFLGMRGSGDFSVTGQRPENWREMILYLYPNGKAPLTAIMSMMKSEKTDDPIFHWFEKELDGQRVAVTGLYEDTGLSDAWANGEELAAGTSVYVKMAAAGLDTFKVGHVIMLTNGTQTSGAFRITGFITAKTAAGASSYLTVKLTETYTMNGATYDVAWVVGTAHSEGDTSGSSIMYDPTEKSNYTQIFRNSLEQTRTAAKTRLRTGDSVKTAKKEALELHSMEMEKAFIFNAAKYATTGTNGKPLRVSAGLRGLITTNKADFTTASGTSTWAAGGEDWFEARLEEVFRYGSEEKLMLCGSGAIVGINALAKANATYQLQPMTTSYGIKVVQWVTPFGVLNLKTHPLMTLEPTTRNTGVIIDPKFLTYRFVDDTTYKPNIQANDLDGEKSEYLTEAGLELHFEKAFAWLDGIGLANP